MEDIDAIMTLYILSSYLTENFYCKHNNNLDVILTMHRR